MANFIQPQIGAAFGAGVQMADAAEDRKVRNRLLDYQVNKAQRDDEAATAVRGAIPGAIAGDPQATATVQQFNPDLWLKLDGQKREADKLKVDAVGRAFTGIKNAPPEQRQTMWDYAKADLAKNGVDVSDMGPMYNPGYVDWHLAKATTVAQQMQQAESRIKTVGNQLVSVTPGGGAKVLHTAPEKPDNTLVEIADPNSPTGTRMAPRAQAANQPGKPPSSMTLTSDGKGGFTMVQGRPGGKPDNAGMGQPTVNKIEEDIVNNNMRMDRLQQIVAGFDPKYLQYGTQVKNWGASVMDKAGVNLDPQTKADLAAYTNFRSTAFNDLTKTLKEMSGAAVTPQEAERLLKVIGDPSNDSPTEFKAKIDATVKSVRLAQARLHWMRANGLSNDKMGSVGLEDMDALIGNRMKAAEAKFKEQGMPDAAAYENARKQTAQEFGMKL